MYKACTRPTYHETVHGTCDMRHAHAARGCCDHGEHARAGVAPRPRVICVPCLTQRWAPRAALAASNRAKRGTPAETAGCSTLRAEINQTT